MRQLVPCVAILSLVGCKPTTKLRAKAPQISVSPDPVQFAPIAPGKTALVSLQVKNAGDLDLHLGGDPQIQETDGDGLTEYSMPVVFARDCTGGDRAAATRLTIVPGDCAEVVLRYAPQNTDGDTANLIFQSDDPQTPTLTVPVGLGQPSHLQVCTVNDSGGDGTCDTPATQPPTVDFGVVAQGGSKRLKVRLKNPGAVPLTQLQVFDPAGPMGAEFQRSANAPVSIDAGGSVDITVLFTPAGSGARLGTMEVDSSDPLRPSVQIPLRGVQEGPALCADPSPLDFGKGSVGTPIDKTLTLSSCGSVAVHLQPVVFDALSPPTFTSTSLPAAQTLQPGDKISFTVRFTPDDSSDQNGAVKVPNDGQPGQYVPLHGTAVFPPVCRLEASAASVDFGQVVRGQSALRPVTVANRGQADCSVSAVKISAGATWFSVITPPTSAVVMHPGDAFTQTVAYNPPAGDANATDSGTLEFDSNDPQHAALPVQLTGTPVASPVCKVTIVPEKFGFGGFTGRVLQFGNVPVGHSKTLPITITNVGSANCSIGGAKFVNGLTSIGGTICFGGTSCGDYKISSPAASSLPPGQSTAYAITFSPKDTNQLPQLPSVYMNFHSGDPAIASECTGNLPADSAAGCIDVGMSGQGDISNLEVIPADLNFGLVTLGCRAAQQTVSLYNTGTVTPIHVTGITMDPASAPFYVQAPPTPFTIAAGTKVPIQVTYKPSAAASETATLQIASDASNATSNNPYVTVGLSGEGTTDKHQVDTFVQSAVPKVDLLFVIDDSASFGFYQDQLSNQASAFVNAALKYHADYQIGVSANDVVDHAAGSDASYSGTIYVGGLYGQPGIVTNTTTDPAGSFAKNVKLGTNGTAQREAGLELARDVLSPPADQKAPPQGSQGFLRDDARLVIIDVQDDDDESNGTTAYYVDFFRNLKGQYNAGMVSFNAIGAFDDSGQPFQCVANDSEPGGQRYYEVAQGTGGKTWSICSSNWAAIADELALGAFQGRVQFPLSRAADPATVVVTLNGGAQVVNVDYTFDQPTNSVIFKAVPPPGATIVVNYDALCF